MNTFTARGKISIIAIILGAVVALVGTGLVTYEYFLRDKPGSFLYPQTPRYEITMIGGDDELLKEFDDCLDSIWDDDLSHRPWVAIPFDYLVTDLKDDSVIMIEDDPKHTDKHDINNDGGTGFEPVHGLLDSDNNIIIREYSFGCPIILHELKHWILRKQGMDTDYFHEQDAIWGPL